MKNNLKTLALLYDEAKRYSTGELREVCRATQGTHGT
jgi:hypothetical protein